MWYICGLIHSSCCSFSCCTFCSPNYIVYVFQIKFGVLCRSVFLWGWMLKDCCEGHHFCGMQNLRWCMDFTWIESEYLSHRPRKKHQSGKWKLTVTLHFGLDNYPWCIAYAYVCSYFKEIKEFWTVNYFIVGIADLNCNLNTPYWVLSFISIIECVKFPISFCFFGSFNFSSFNYTYTCFSLYLWFSFCN